MTHLGLVDLLSLSKVCKDLRTVVWLLHVKHRLHVRPSATLNEEAFSQHKRKDRGGTGTITQVLFFLEENCPRLGSMDASHCEFLVDPHLHLLPTSLLELDLRFCSRITGLGALQERLVHLRSLNIGWCSGLPSLEGLPSHLHDLNLSGLTFHMRELVHLPKGLKALNLSNVEIEAFDASTWHRYLPPQLQQLVLDGCDFVTTEACQALPKELRLLDLSDTKVSDRAMGLLPRRLTALDLSHCRQLLGNGWKDLPSGLSSLNLCECLELRHLRDLPDALQELKLGPSPTSLSSEEAERGFLPPSLRALELHNWTAPLRFPGSLASSLQELRFCISGRDGERNAVVPYPQLMGLSSLRSLSIPILAGAKLPQSVKDLEIVLTTRSNDTAFAEHLSPLHTLRIREHNVFRGDPIPPPLQATDRLYLRRDSKITCAQLPPTLNVLKADIPENDLQNLPSGLTRLELLDFRGPAERLALLPPSIRKLTLHWRASLEEKEERWYGRKYVKGKEEEEEEGGEGGIEDSLLRYLPTALRVLRIKRDHGVEHVLDLFEA
ncbi:hypothetical protein QOT17_006488 [Balamuthia mandrillaris]